MEPSSDLQNYTQPNPPATSDSPSATVTTSSSPWPPPPTDTLDFEARARKKEHDAELRALSKSFGHIPNIPVFTQWDTRYNCSLSGVHRPIMAGIYGNPRDGTFSVVLSNAYKDDEDGGDVIIYTGSGGRERFSNASPPKRLRLGPQTMDQTWENSSNKALQVSLFTGEPIRVIRSCKCNSKYAPLAGYRYDGLYKVAACWTAKGRNGKMICRCRLERLPHQPPIPLRPITMSTSRKHRERLVSNLSPSPLFTNPYGISDGANVENQPCVSPGQPARAGGESEGLQSSPQQRATNISTGVDMGESNPDVKCPQPMTPQPVPPKPSALPRYRWDPRNNRLIRVPTSDTIGESDDAAGADEEGNRVEGDDATLVPSEDGHVDVPDRMEMDCLSDTGNADEPPASGFSLLDDTDML